MAGLTLRAGCLAAAGAGIVLLAAAPAFAYGLDGLFGGRPNPDGSVTVDVPISTESAPDRAQTVLQHPRPDYDPGPMRLGSFDVFPLLEAGAAYNSNIYGTPAATPDEILSLHPNVTATSDWNRHFLSVTADGDFNFFQEHPDQSLNTTLFQADGRYDLLNQTWLAGHGGYQMQFVPRSTLSNTAGNQPTTFNLYSAGVSAFRGAGILHAQADYSFDHYDYSNSPVSGPGYSLYNRDENKAGGRLTYVVTEDFKPYVSGQVNSRDYSANPLQSSQGYKADAGVTWDFGGITSIDVYGGWLSQDYSSFGPQSVNQGPDFGGKLTWNISGLTTLVLDSDRSVQEALLIGENSFMSTGASATLTHELRRNILLEGDLAYTNDSYRGAVARSDDVTTAGAGLRYLVNRHLYTDLDYSWNHRVSSVEQQGYVDHLIVAKLGVRF